MATITGTNNNDSLTGGAANDIINGLAGVDTMAGGLGNDVYYVDNVLDVVKESANQGIDTVNSTAVHYMLADNVERLFLSTGAIYGDGNSQNNIILGNDLGNGIDGRGGADFMMGGKGNDVYDVDNVGDKVVEFAGQGTDAIHSTISYSIAALGNVENLNLMFGASTAIKATGNALSNMIGGNEFENIIDGGAGADIMGGWTGNDTYLVDNIGDQIVEYSWEGASDSVISSIALKNAFANVENYDFSKVAVAVDFTADGADNVIKSGLAADKLTGGAGNDTYYLNNSGDVVVELAGGGTDTVVSGNINLDLSKYAFVENAKLTGAAALKLIGSAGANVLTGNVGANVLDGKGGADVMSGGKGNDTYMVDSILDQVVEKAGEGIDRVMSSVNRTLDANVEQLFLLTGALNGTGNALNNLLVGNGAANLLDGGAGADVMKGGKGDDTYVVDNAGDSIIEIAGDGRDAVRSSINFSIAGLVPVDDL
jgi:Ca2+-binding RTX toxin-like protein